MSHTPLRMWGQGAITLPKKWRDQFNTKNFMAVETKEGLLIQPSKEAEVEVEYYENGPNEFGLHFPKGISPARFVELMDAAEASLRSTRRKKRVSRK